MLLQIEDYFFKKEKESIRILHISDSLKINVYLLQAAQCVFSFSPKRGNFIFKQCLRLLVGCYFHMNVDFGIFYLGKRYPKYRKGTDTARGSSPAWQQEGVLC